MAVFVTEGVASTSQTFANAQVLEFQQDFRVAFYEMATFQQIASVPTAINGKSFEFTFFPTLGISTSALVEADDVTSVTLTPTKKVMEAKEHGNAVTVTDLSDFQTRSKSSRATAEIVAINAAQTVTRLAMEAADASTNVIRPNDRANDGAIVAGDVLSASVLEDAYTDLASANVPMMDGLYILVAHDRVISDIRGSSDWITINRYNRDMDVLRNEVGTYKGFRIIRNNLCTVSADAGAGNVDVYNSYALGMDAIAYGERSAPEIIVTSFDKLRRFTNIGWKWLGIHTILRQESLQLLKTSSSRGANT